MKEELKQTKKRVQQILEENILARENDLVLYSIYFKDKYGTTDLWRITNLVKGNEFETVSRCRRKIQAENPFLDSGKTIRDLRSANEETFREEFNPCKLF